MFYRAFHRQFITIAHLASRLYPQPPATTGANINPLHASSHTPTSGAGHGPNFFASSQTRNIRGALEAYADVQRRRVLTVGESPNERFI
uniref:Uncharacterized protein n=1 Tax=Panagrolaimus superbus TaxID=310955 RepID=A0A914Y5E6_9BILA